MRGVRLVDRRVIKRRHALEQRLARQDVAVRHYGRDEVVRRLAQLAIALEPLLAELRRQLVAALDHADDLEHWTNSITANRAVSLLQYLQARDVPVLPG